VFTEKNPKNFCDSAFTRQIIKQVIIHWIL